MGCVNSAGHYVDTMRSVLNGTADLTTGPADKPDPPKKVDEQDPDVIKRRINLLTRRMASYVDEQIAAGDGETLALMQRWICWRQLASIFIAARASRSNLRSRGASSG